MNAARKGVTDDTLAPLLAQFKAAVEGEAAASLTSGAGNETLLELTICLEENILNDAGIQALEDTLTDLLNRCRCFVRRLRLYSNAIGDAGAASVAAIMLHQGASQPASPIAEVHLSHNKITALGAEALFAAAAQLAEARQLPVRPGGGRGPAVVDDARTASGLPLRPDWAAVDLTSCKPLWMRLEYNLIDRVALEGATQGWGCVGRETRGQGPPFLCFAHMQRGCCLHKCVCHDRADCGPVAMHLPWFENQRQSWQSLRKRVVLPSAVPAGAASIPSYPIEQASAASESVPALPTTPAEGTQRPSQVYLLLDTNVILYLLGAAGQQDLGIPFTSMEDALEMLGGSGGDPAVVMVLADTVRGELDGLKCRKHGESSAAFHTRRSAISAFVKSGGILDKGMSSGALSWLARDDAEDRVLATATGDTPGAAARNVGDVRAQLHESTDGIILRVGQVLAGDLQGSDAVLLFVSQDSFALQRARRDFQLHCATLAQLLQALDAARASGPVSGADLIACFPDAVWSPPPSPTPSPFHRSDRAPAERLGTSPGAPSTQLFTDAPHAAEEGAGADLGGEAAAGQALATQVLRRVQACFATGALAGLVEVDTEGGLYLDAASVLELQALGADIDVALQSAE